MGKRKQPEVMKQPEVEDIHSKFNRNAYTNRLPYFNSQLNPEANKAYHEEERRLMEEFKKDLFADLGIVGNQKAEQLYSIAWAEGHANGFHSVYYYADLMVSLIKD